MILKKQIPNLLTFGRVLCVPASLLVMLLLPVLHPALFWIFLAAIVTDFLDGFLARRWHAVSPSGAMLDPIADKLLVALLLMYLLAISASGPAINLLMNPLFIPVSLIILRELYISGLREFLAVRGKELPVSKGGKLKTLLQMSGILLMLSPPIVRDFTPLTIGLAVLWLATAVTWISAIHYTIKSRSALKATA